MLSVLMAVYAKENREFLNAALKSLCDQTRPPDEVVLVKDGPLGPELERVLELFRSCLPLKLIELPKARGLGNALRVGILQCRAEVVARMDSDDICLPDRFRNQLDFLDQHPEVDVVGSHIAEFDVDPKSPQTIRSVPESHSAIERMARTRSPVNHMTVMYRRAAVLRAGNYEAEKVQEDYKLWARMLVAGSRFHNLQQVLVLARTGNGMIRRRGGWAFAKNEVRLQLYFRRIGFTSSFQLVFNLATRVPTVLAPHSARRLMYRYLLRRTAL